MPHRKALLLLLVAAGVVLAGCAAPTADAPEDDPLFAQIHEANAHLATPEAAAKAGYVAVTGFVPGMGHHYLHPEYAMLPFDPLRPPLLTFSADTGGHLRLAAVEYSAPRETNIPPDGFPGEADVWDIHEANCHFEDGTEVHETLDVRCPSASPATGAKFLLWHPDLWTLHVWLFQENPNGLFAPQNPRAAPAS